jgi:SOS-response transcriptional repressor LexA
MEPGLRAGALVIARPVGARTRLRVGDIVVARRPDGQETIKRIRSIDPNDGIFLIADNPAGRDSYDFGPIRLDDVIARVRWRYWPFPPRRL